MLFLGWPPVRLLCGRVLHEARKDVLYPDGRGLGSQDVPPAGDAQEKHRPGASLHDLLCTCSVVWVPARLSHSRRGPLSCNAGHERGVSEGVPAVVPLQTVPYDYAQAYLLTLHRFTIIHLWRRDVNMLTPLPPPLLQT